MNRSVSTFRHAHIHGFSSNAQSSKGLYLAERFEGRGLDLVLPELNQPSFEEITFGNALEAIATMDVEHGDSSIPWRISASSMGAYLVSLWAQENPEKVDRLCLMSPAFGLGERFVDLVGEDAMARWEDDGELPLPGPDDELRSVHWRLVEEAAHYPTHPEVPCSTVIVHGRGDETISVESSRHYAQDRDHVRLIEVDDDHSLENSLELLWDVICEHFEFSEPR